MSPVSASGPVTTTTECSSFGCAVVTGLRRGVRAFVWYVKAVLGESDYDRYVDHLKRHHPDQPAPTVQAYWRERYAEEARHPASRCC